MKIATAPDFLEFVANHPAVLPMVSCDGGRIRFGMFWDRCIGFEFEDGGFLAERIEPDVWEIHTLFLPVHTDIPAKAKEVGNYLFFDKQARELFTVVPEDNVPARWLARKMGFEFARRDPQGWMRPTGAIPLDLFILTRERWEALWP